MIALLLISIFILALASAVYLRSKKSASTDESARALPPMPEGYAGLFGGPSAEADKEARAAESYGRMQALATDLRRRAERGELSVLLFAHESGVEGLYDELLSAHVSRASAAGSEEELNSLAAFVTRHRQLRGNAALAEAVLGRWERAPDRASTSRALRVAALSDDANVFSRAVETAMRLWREGKLSGVRAEDLAAQLEGEYWVLSSEARGSGAGFVLKQTLADARRELLDAPNPPATDKAEN
ncbi:MAG TPA: hypothetical protein VGV38_20015 [Pyrinomonadaceae bacterium]|nr:hypothetical protein [Pyrinomonadaceae bacterium]